MSEAKTYHGPSPALMQDNVESEIITTLHNIIINLKKDGDAMRTDLSKIKQAVMTPEQVDQLVNAHQKKQGEDIRELKQTVTSLKVKSQERLSMDPAFMEEVRQLAAGVAKEQRMGVVAEHFSDELSDAQREQIRQELQKHLSEKPRKTGEAVLMTRPITGVKTSKFNPVFPFMNEKGTVSTSNRKNRFTEKQKFLVAQEQEKYKARVLFMRKAFVDAAPMVARIQSFHADNKADDDEIQLLTNEWLAIVGNIPGAADEMHRLTLKVQAAEKMKEILQIEYRKMGRISQSDVNDIPQAEIEKQIEELNKRVTTNNASLYQAQEQIKVLQLQHIP